MRWVLGDMRQVCLAIGAFLLVGVATRGFAQEVEGVKVVRKITFKGNTAIDEKTLRASIASRQAPLLYRLALTRWIGLAHAPAFDPHEVRRDVPPIPALAPESPRSLSRAPRRSTSASS